MMKPQQNAAVTTNMNLSSGGLVQNVIIWADVFGFLFLFFHVRVQKKKKNLFGQTWEVSRLAP
jgi:hypothetical protein